MESNSGVSLSRLSYPVVQTQKFSWAGSPVVYAYDSAQRASSTGRCRVRIRHRQRQSRPVREVHSFSLGTLNTQGLSWDCLGHRDKLVWLLEFMRASRLDMLSLTELHGITPCVVLLGMHGRLMTLEFYCHWSLSGRQRFDHGGHCGIRINF